MTDFLTVAVDGMGGDHGPKLVIDGLAVAQNRLSEVRFLVFGDEALLGPLIDAHSGLGEVCEIRHAPDNIDMETKPTKALRSGRKSSMRLAIDAVASGEASAIVSAGNTGALMAMATIVLRTIPGISRPAIAAVMPTETGETVMLDLGANVACDAENLVQFAVMGEAYARNVLGLEQPTVGILNIGVEDLKGVTSVREASAILQESDLPIKFYGFVEGDDLGKGTVDVIVTDGFTGNIALKAIEGMVKLFSNVLRQSLTSTLISKIGALLVHGALKQFRARFDPRLYNGAMLVGLNGICVKSHGSTDAVGFANALGVAVNMVRRGFNERIKKDLTHLHMEAGENVEGEEPTAAAM